MVVKRKGKKDALKRLSTSSSVRARIRTFISSASGNWLARCPLPHGWLREFMDEQVLLDRVAGAV